MELDISFQKTIARQLQTAAKNVQWETRFAKDLRADHLNFLALVLEVEEQYRCYLTDAGLALVATVGDLAQLLQDEAGVEVYRDEEDGGEGEEVHAEV